MLSRRLVVTETRNTRPCVVCNREGWTGRHVRSRHETRIKNTEGRNMMEQVSRGERKEQGQESVF